MSAPAKGKSARYYGRKPEILTNLMLGGKNLLSLALLLLGGASDQPPHD
jgi:hypothetical protein